MEIGFVGAGRMGAPMAANLARAGWAVLVHDPAADLAEVRAAGARVVGSLAELAHTDVTISMLPDAAVTTAVLEELAPQTPDGHIHVAMGTIGVDGAAEALAVVESAGRRFADAPVSGSVALARSAQISTMVGASPEVFAAVRPLLAVMTTAQTLVGPPGAGSAVKLAVNIVIGTTNQAIAEALVFAQAHGIAPETTYDVLAASAVASPYLGYKREEFLHPGATPPSAPVAVVHKDLTLALDAGGRAAVFLPGASAVRQVLVTATALGLRDEDMSRVIDVVRQLSGPPAAAGEASPRPFAPDEAASPAGPEQEVLRAEDARYRAMLDGDATALGALMHDELCYTHSTASRDTKDSLLRKITEEALVYREIEHPVERVAVVGDTAIVAGKMIASLLVDGSPRRLDNRALSVWVRADGGWRLLAFQPTPIPPTG